MFVKIVLLNTGDRSAVVKKAGNEDVVEVCV